MGPGTPVPIVRASTLVRGTIPISAFVRKPSSAARNSSGDPVRSTTSIPVFEASSAATSLRIVPGRAPDATLGVTRAPSSRRNRLAALAQARSPAVLSRSASARPAGLGLTAGQHVVQVVQRLDPRQRRALVTRDAADDRPRAAVVEPGRAARERLRVYHQRRSRPRFRQEAAALRDAPAYRQAHRGFGEPVGRQRPRDRIGQLFVLREGRQPEHGRTGPQAAEVAFDPEDGASPGPHGLEQPVAQCETPVARVQGGSTYRRQPPVDPQKKGLAHHSSGSAPSAPSRALPLARVSAYSVSGSES